MGYHLVEAFLEMMSAERGASKNTLESYERDLAAYLSFAGECNADVKSIPTSLIERHLGNIAASGMAASTQARNLSAIRQFHKFLFSEGVRTDDPCGTMGLISSAISPKVPDAMRISWLFIQFRLPFSVLISPL